MKCPVCTQDLMQEEYQGIAVEKCTQCGGMWFNAQEVDQLEDTVFDQDEFKSTMITNVRDSQKNCPKCTQKMKTFDYRWEDLALDYCPHGDGYWLDQGEEKRVTEIIAQEAHDTERSLKAERQWIQVLKGFQSPTFVAKIKDLLQL